MATLYPIGKGSAAPSQPNAAQEQARDRAAAIHAEWKARLAEDAALTVGQSVTVYWGYGLGFRAKGPGVIVKLFRTCEQVRLTADVQSPSRGEVGWREGSILKGIPRVLQADWRYKEHGVIPLEQAKP